MNWTVEQGELYNLPFEIKVLTCPSENQKICQIAPNWSGLSLKAICDMKDAEQGGQLPDIVDILLEDRL